MVVEEFKLILVGEYAQIFTEEFNINDEESKLLKIMYELKMTLEEEFVLILPWSYKENDSD